MKSLKTTMTALLVLAFIHIANAAPVTVRITGAAADKSTVHKAIIALLGGNTTTYTLPAGSTYAYTGPNSATTGGFPAATYAIFSGSATINGTSTPIVFKTSWTGAVGGILTVSKQIPNLFLSSTVTQSSAGTPNAAVPTSGSNGESAISNVCMSDVFQASTQYANIPAPNGLTEAIEPGFVTGLGITAYQWVINAGAPSYINNMTPQFAQYLFGGGQAPLALLTGSTSDENVIVSAIGRDTDSAVRANAFAETGVGIAAAVTQYQPTLSGSNTITGENPYPAETLYNTIVLGTGNGGYATAGPLISAVNSPGSLSGIGGYYITYFSTSDAATAVAGGAHVLNYDGVPYSAKAVQEGQYTFWGYTHLYYYPSTPADQQAVINALAVKIPLYVPITLDSMNVSRATDGGNVQANYF